MANDILMRARITKNDEFYTYYDDIKNELEHYIDLFKDKSVYCPCDTENSNFFQFFMDHFKDFKLTEVCASSLNNGINYYVGTGYSVHLDYEPGTGDIFGPYVREKLEKYDIICTNPPFSLLKDFIELLVKLNKKFLIVANENVLVNPRVFPYIMNDFIKTGINRIKSFKSPAGEDIKFGNIIWLTNLSIDKPYHTFQLKKQYSPENYPKMENYEAINVDKIVDIPCDYNGVMGVPITYLKNHNPNQFKILGYAGGTTKNSGQNYTVKYTPHPDDHGGSAMVNGTRKYGRVFIQHV